MNPAGDAILADLNRVAAERARREADGRLSARVAALKGFQQRRIARTHADLLSHDRYRAAARFFLDELYGPGDFSRRDQQFERIVPALVRLFAAPVVETVATVVRLHALSESLDTAMATHDEGDAWTPEVYVRCWQLTGRAAERDAQVAQTVAVLTRLDELTRKPLLSASLRLMRAPARAAGLETLQHFLETGFDAFRSIGDAAEFIRRVEGRERRFVASMFAADPHRLDPAVDAELAG